MHAVLSGLTRPGKYEPIIRPTVDGLTALAPDLSSAALRRPAMHELANRANCSLESCCLSCGNFSMFVEERRNLIRLSATHSAFGADPSRLGP